jgi:hypothetical protein
MPEVQHLDHALVFADLVVNQNRTVSEFANSRSLPDCSTHTREIGQELYVIEKRLTKARGGLTIVFSDAPDDFGYIA